MTEYMQIVQYIKQCIDDNILKPGDPLPGENELMEEFNVSSITVRKAMEILVEEKVIYRVKGKGTYVAEPYAGSELDNPKKIYLIFDDVESLDASLNKIVQGIKRYYKDKNCLIALEDYLFCDRLLKREYENDNETGLIVYIDPSDVCKKYESLRKLNSNGIKFVCIDRYFGNHPVNYVGCNNHDAVYTAVEHLVKLGHQRILFLHERPEISSEIERYAGYGDAMHDYNLENYIQKGISVFETEAWKAALKQENATAIICANDYTASIAISTLKDMGLNVPGDISVVGFDDSETYRYYLPALTTLRQDFCAIGYEAARILYKLMLGTAVGYTKMYIPAQLIVRDSTGNAVS